MLEEIQAFVSANNGLIGFLGVVAAIAGPFVSRMEYDWKRKSILRDIEIFEAWKEHGDADLLVAIHGRINRALRKKYCRSTLNAVLQVFYLIGALFYAALCAFSFLNGSSSAGAIYGVMALVFTAFAAVIQWLRKKEKDMKAQLKKDYEQQRKSFAAMMKDLLLCWKSGVPLDELLHSTEEKHAIADKLVELTSSGDPISKRLCEEMLRDSVEDLKDWEDEFLAEEFSKDIEAN